MSKEAFFLGEPVQFKPGIMIYPPKVKDVAANDHYGVYSRLLTYSQEEVEDEFLEANKPLESYPTPIEFLLNNSYHHKEYEKQCKAAFQFFIHEEVSFLYDQKMIIIGKLEDVLKKAQSLDDLVIIKEEDFFDFQNMIRESVGRKTVELPNPNEHPKVKEMKRKARYRDKIKAKQGSGINLLTSLASICCMGIGITPLNIGEMSYASIGILINTYQNKEKYEIDIASIQAGANPKKINPKYWIKNLD